MYKLKLEDKYEIRLDEENFKVFKVSRYGEDWKDLTGDNFTLALVHKIQALQDELDAIYESQAGSSL
jgi:hypothetical protein